MKQRFTATVALMALLSSSTVPTLTQAAESAKVLTQTDQSEISNTSELSVNTSEQQTVSSKATKVSQTSKQQETKVTVDENTNQLNLDKQKAQESLNQLSDLSQEKKNDYKYRINNAKTSNEVTTIYKEAEKANSVNANAKKELADKKVKAKATVNRLSKLSSKQKQTYIKNIEVATTVNDVDNIVTTASKVNQSKIEAEATRKAQEEQQRREAEATRKAQEEQQRREAEAARKAQEEQQRREAEAARKAQEEQQHREAEATRKAQEEQQRREGESTGTVKTTTSSTSQQKTSSSQNSQRDTKKTMTSSSKKGYKQSTKKVTTKPRRQSMSSSAIATLDRQLGLDDETEESSIKISPNMTGKEFIEAIADYAQEVAEENDLYASVMIAQACLETGFGTSGLSSSPYYNFFGIKGSYKGKSVTMATLEDSSSGMYSINAAFRDYPSPKESLEDYADLLKTNFYRGAWKSNTDSYRDATRFLTGRYATDRNYYRKLNGIIEAYNLTQYDDPTNKGQMKRIKKVSKVYYTVRLGDTINKLAKAHHNTAKELKEWNKDKLKNINLIFPGQKLIVDKKVTYEYVKVDEKDKDASAKQGQFNLPLKKGSYTVTSPFGNRTAPNAAAGNYHEGIDLAVPMNSNVYATREGVVFASGYDASAGNYIFVYHGNGLFSNYFHLSRATVNIGDRVKAGEVIAKSGSTGNSTGPHLHFGISHRVWGDYENPEDYLNF